MRTCFNSHLVRLELLKRGWQLSDLAKQAAVRANCQGRRARAQSLNRYRLKGCAGVRNGILQTRASLHSSTGARSTQNKSFLRYCLGPATRPSDGPSDDLAAWESARSPGIPIDSRVWKWLPWFVGGPWPRLWTRFAWQPDITEGSFTKRGRRVVRGGGL